MLGHEGPPQAKSTAQVGPRRVPGLGHTNVFFLYCESRQACLTFVHRSMQSMLTHMGCDEYAYVHRSSIRLDRFALADFFVHRWHLWSSQGCLEGLFDANAAVRGLHGKNIQGKTAVQHAKLQRMSTMPRTGGGGGYLVAVGWSNSSAAR